MATGELLTQLSDQLASLVEAAAPGVVQVSGRHGRPATGTVFRKGRVLVPAHAVGRDNELKIGDGEGNLTAAEYLGADPATDLAVLRSEAWTLPAIDRSSAPPRVGQLAVAFGRTWSAALVASAGIVSAIGGPLRTGRGRSVEQVLRADVRVHPFGAGGPLVDASGRALGIATGAFMRGLPLFVPASIAWRVGEAIEAHGGVKRGYLGISAQPVQLGERQRAGRAQGVGLLVIAVAADSPAEQGGLLVGDILVGFDGQPIEDHEVLLSLLSGDRVGKLLPLEILRAGALQAVQVTVGSRQ